ncbi:hypothetical protein Dsin_018254 [Dipteronia sinensis]|uniref:Uncharacterized protein n=1 Tax=Dipteronia sinensis TaxID=43782 RepID=A0AAE0E1Q9_9ROSI|nr:hypothetical protein Dsin_018254 [Dipteronia sinensis]
MKPNKDSQLRLELENALVTKSGLGFQDSVDPGSGITYGEVVSDDKEIGEIKIRARRWELLAREGGHVRSDVEPSGLLGERDAACWADQEEYRGLVARNWNPSSGDMALEGVVSTINQCKKHLNRWNLGNRRNLRAEICKQQKKLQRATTSILLGSWSLIREIESNIDVLMEKEDAYGSSVLASSG